MTSARAIGPAVLLAATVGVGLGACRDRPSANVDAGVVATDAQALRPSTAARPPVVVSIVVDQLAAWIFTERLPKLPDDGGFKRLLKEGTWVKAMRYAHAVTDTAPGHAALYTGAVPRESGIVGNEIVDENRAVVSVLRDPAAKVVYPNAIDPGPSSSPARLRVDTVADRLRAAQPDAFIVSLSLKDRGAIIPAGKKPNAAVWLDTSQARFVTSTAFGPELPAWVDKRGDQTGVLRALNSPWTRSSTAAAATPDDQPGEGDESGLGRLFPHDLAAVRSPARVFRTLPVSDELLLGMGLDALEAAAKPEQPTLLALSLSAHDYVGHVFGPDSVEALEELMRLDRALATFFTVLDVRYGKDGWAAMLSADHGTINMPEAAKVPGVRHWCSGDAGNDAWHRPCGASYRVDLEDLTATLMRAAERAFPGKTDLVRGTADPYVFVGEGARALGAAERGKLDAALGAALQKIPGVRRVFSVDALPATCPPLEGDEALKEDDRIAALVCRSAIARDEYRGALYVVLAPGSFFDPRVVRGFGTSHGSPYLYDRTVPMLVRAPGRAPAGLAIEEPIDFRAFARTLSGLLGVEPPPAALPGRTLLKK